MAMSIDKNGNWMKFYDLDCSKMMFNPFNRVVKNFLVLWVTLWHACGEARRLITGLGWLAELHVVM